MGALTARGKLLTPANLEESYRLREEAKKTKKCAFCGKPIVYPQRVYCSYACNYDFSVKYYGNDWNTTRKTIIKRDGHTCQICSRKCRGIDNRYVSNCDCEVDHMKEVADGGTDEESNLRVLCYICHRKKTSDYLRKKLRKPKSNKPEDQASLDPKAFNLVDTQDIL